MPRDLLANGVSGKLAPRDLITGTNQPPGVPEFNPGVAGYDPKTGEVTPQYGPAGSAAMGAADTGSLGFGDELASYLGSLISGKPRDQVLAEMRGDANAAKTQNPGSYLAGQIAGGVAQTAATGGAGLGTAAARSGAGLGKIALGSALDAAGYGGAYGAGSADDGDRLGGAAKGALIGGSVGAVAPLAVAGVRTLASPLLAPIMARLNPGTYADKVLNTTAQRAGMTGDDIADMLSRAQADNQGMFSVADALGHQGGRALSTVVRNPNDARQQIVDALADRQMGQGERLSNFLAEGFGAPDTAAQRAASLGANRASEAATNYGAARAASGPVDLSGTVDTIDSLLGRDPIMGDTALSAGPLGNRLQALRDQLQKGGEQLVDFNRVLNIKSDLYNAMQDNPRVANEMRPVYNALDTALENASTGYRNANDSYRAASKVIDALDTGRNAASGRTRAPDNIATFGALTPDEQNAFRAGYVDPFIARTENMAVSPTTNKARMLMTTKTGQEFPAFALPGKADQLGNRVAREQQMFDTANAALGGSKTADNLADAAEMAKFDPSVMTKLFTGGPVAAVMDAVTKLINEGRGLPPGVLERVGQSLMITDPAAARAVFGAAQQNAQNSAGRQAITAALLRSAALPATSP